MSTEIESLVRAWARVDTTNEEWAGQGVENVVKNGVGVYTFTLADSHENTSPESLCQLSVNDFSQPFSMGYAYPSTVDPDDDAKKVIVFIFDEDGAAFDVDFFSFLFRTCQVEAESQLVA